MTTINLSLSSAVEAKLREKAALSGQPFDAYATAVLERAAAALAIDEILAPVRRQVAASGLADGELDSLLEEARDKAFQTRQGRPA